MIIPNIASVVYAPNQSSTSRYIQWYPDKALVYPDNLMVECCKFHDYIPTPWYILIIECVKSLLVVNPTGTHFHDMNGLQRGWSPHGTSIFLAFSHLPLFTMIYHSEQPVFTMIYQYMLVVFLVTVIVAASHHELFTTKLNCFQHWMVQSG